MNEFIFPDNVWLALTAIGTIAMSIGTFLTIRESYLSRRTKLFATITVHSTKSTNGKNKKFWCLEIQNISKTPAYNIHLHISKEFCQSIPLIFTRDTFCKLQEHVFAINPECSKIYPLCPISATHEEYNDDYPQPGQYKQAVDAWLKEYFAKPFTIELNYNDRCTTERTMLCIEHFNTRSALFKD